MKCFSCKNENLNETTTNYFVDLKSCMVIVRNVPCSECEQCGEKYFNDEVAERLDKIIENISSTLTEIAVVNFSDNVA